MIPYGWTTELLDNYQELFDIGTIALESLHSKFQTNYQIGSIANIICKEKYLWHRSYVKSFKKDDFAPDPYRRLSS